MEPRSLPLRQPALDFDSFRAGEDLRRPSTSLAGHTELARSPVVSVTENGNRQAERMERHDLLGREKEVETTTKVDNPVFVRSGTRMRSKREAGRLLKAKGDGICCGVLLFLLSFQVQARPGRLNLLKACGITEI